MTRVVSTQLAGRTLTIEYGKLARQASGSVVLRYGDTVVLATTVGAKEPRKDVDFLPLTVDYQEKFYSSGRIPGGFYKREGRPSDQATLIARLIDRPIRPLFPKGYNRDVHIVATVLSVDNDNDPAVLALLGASTSLYISSIPFMQPVAGVRMGRIGGEFICNPTAEQQRESDIDLFVAGTSESIVMVEGSAAGSSEREILDALDFAHGEIKRLLHIQEELFEFVAPKKEKFLGISEDEEMKKKIQALLVPTLPDVYARTLKRERSEGMSQLKKEVIERLLEEYPEAERTEECQKKIAWHFNSVRNTFARQWTLSQGKRIDGRDYKDIRPIHCEVGLLPRTHGSALFVRGETQALVTATLGTAEDVQRIDSPLEVSTESFMLHYNFPPFAVGEAGALRGPGRREIGHGALTRRSISSVIPSATAFPYTIRLVSEILESNGSSSMASVCGASLALMDAGVPITDTISGIAMGLILDGDQVAILSDITGEEDQFGDMDFKITGSEEGITALQMDIKCRGISREILSRALEQAKEGRVYILGEMLKVLDAPRPTLSKYAPKIQMIEIKPDKIRDIIGPGGKVINGIIAKTKVKIDVDESGRIHVAAVDGAAVDEAIRMIREITAEPVVGEVYKGRVRKVVEFGAFVDILPNTSGLVHISELSHHHVRNIYDIVKEGDEMEVKVIGIDYEGRIKLSRKVLLSPDQEVLPKSVTTERKPGRGYRDRDAERENKD